VGRSQGVSIWTQGDLKKLELKGKPDSLIGYLCKIRKNRLIDVFAKGGNSGEEEKEIHCSKIA